MRIRRLGISALSAIALFEATTPATANVIALFTVTPTSIEAGDNALLTLTLTLSPDPGFSFALWQTLSLTLFSGTGEETTFGLSGSGSTRTFSETFTYANAGTFFPEYRADYSYFQQGTISFPPATIRQTKFDHIQNATRLDVTETVAPVPLPAALPLFAGGLGLLGWMARRKRKQLAHA